MRRKVTLNLDEDFIRGLDAFRKMTPRSRMIEQLAELGAIEEGGGLPEVPSPEEQAKRDAEDRSTNPPVSEVVRRGTPQRERSPAPNSERRTERRWREAPSSEAMPEAYQEPLKPSRLSKPPLLRPIVQKRGS